MGEDHGTMVSLFHFLRRTEGGKGGRDRLKAVSTTCSPRRRRGTRLLNEHRWMKEEAQMGGKVTHKPDLMNKCSDRCCGVC